MNTTEFCSSMKERVIKTMPDALKEVFGDSFDVVDYPVILKLPKAFMATLSFFQKETTGKISELFEEIILSKMFLKKGHADQEIDTDVLIKVLQSYAVLKIEAREHEAKHGKNDVL